MHAQLMHRGAWVPGHANMDPHQADQVMHRWWRQNVNEPTLGIFPGKRIVPDHPELARIHQGRVTTHRQGGAGALGRPVLLAWPDERDLSMAVGAAKGSLLMVIDQSGNTNDLIPGWATACGAVNVLTKEHTPQLAPELVKAAIGALSYDDELRSSPAGRSRKKTGMAVRYLSEFVEAGLSSKFTLGVLFAYGASELIVEHFEKHWEKAGGSPWRFDASRLTSTDTPSS